MVQNLSKKTLINMMSKLRAICKQETEYFHKTYAFGDEVDCLCLDVEIDEACFGKKRKNGKGKMYKKQWVFGITQRKSQKVYFKLVSDRTKSTLLPLILQHISKSAIIHHDDWPGYRNLHQYGYKHLFVKHTDHFKGKDGACTNTIEGLWGVLKQRIARMHGIDSSKLDLYLGEFTFRYIHNKNMLQALMCCICNIKK